MARVFVSYSHDSDAHKSAVARFVSSVRENGHEVHFDQEETFPPMGWPAWMEQQIRMAEKVFVVCSIGYKAKFQGEFPEGQGLGGKWEGAIITQALYRAEGHNDKFIPVIVPSDVGWDIPTLLEPYQHFNVGQSEELQTLLSLLGTRHVPAPVSNAIAIKRRILEHGFPEGQELFVGRQRELDLLNEAWFSTVPNVVEIVGWGGSGKTALAANWLMRMSQQLREGEIPVVAWSFYSQGSFDNEVSAQAFFEQALSHLEEDVPTKADAIERGRRLAQAVAKRRCLVILDGIEGLQYTSGSDKGRIKDPGLGEFIRHISIDNPGLVVITTRVQLALWVAPDDHFYIRHDLADMPAHDGAALLRKLGCQGPDQELQAASQEFGGHALALNLLGAYVRDALHGDIRRRGEIPLLDSYQPLSGHAQRILASYERWLEPPARQMMYLLGLHDGPASFASLEAICKNDIKGLTDQLHGFVGPRLSNVIANLVSANLAHDRVAQDGTIDCHPLVRQYFQTRLGTIPEAAKEGHRLLYNHYSRLAKSQTNPHRQVTFLVEAICHGCAAGLELEALEGLYIKGLQRGQDYATSKLGAFGPALTALASFFESKWDKPLSSFSSRQRAFLFSQAARALRALGRLQESLTPTEASLQNYEHTANWMDAAAECENLVDVHVFLGNLEAGLEAAARDERNARKTGNPGAVRAARAARAFVLSKMGKPEAKGLFDEIFSRRATRLGPAPEFWHSAYGPEHCQLLVELGHFEVAESRARRVLGGALKDGAPLDMGLAKFALANAILQSDKGSKTRRQEAKQLLEEAHKLVVASGQHAYLPPILILRARLLRAGRDLSGAQDNLSEAEQLAWRFGLRLMEVDCLIEQARVCAEGDNVRQSYECYVAAKEKSELVGYGRKTKEIESLPHKHLAEPTKLPPLRRNWIDRLLAR